MTMSDDLARSGAPVRSSRCSARAPKVRPFRALFDRSTLPPDVIDDEVTAVVCFKASLALNRLLGGQPDMTLSARIHAATREPGARRILWTAAERGVDFACGVLRGEAHHCETAWINYCRRPKARTARKGGRAAQVSSSSNSMYF